MPDGKGNNVSGVKRTCGFQLIPIESVGYLVVFATSILLLPYLGEAAPLFPIALFFLFVLAFVFRLTGIYLLAWGLVYVFNASYFLAGLNQPNWLRLFYVQGGATLFLIIVGMLSPSYHGIFCRRINARNIDAWLAKEIPLRKRTCGFQITAPEVIVMVLIVAGAWFVFFPIGLVALFVVGHFFLFCNVFRIRPAYEFIWGAAFISNVLIQAFIDYKGLNWLLVIIIQCIVTIAVIIAEMRSSRYHGIFCRRINAKHIDDYLGGKIK